MFKALERVHERKWYIVPLALMSGAIIAASRHAAPQNQQACRAHSFGFKSPSAHSEPSVPYMPR